MSQIHVLRHYARLSQENLGVDLNIDIGQGTCTMKYSPKVNDQLARSPKLTELHPLQDASTVQGILEIMYRMEQIFKEISGLDRVTFQPSAGSAAIFANICMLRAYHESRGQGKQRDQVVTTIFSHPSNAAAAKVAGYEVITLYPDEDGYVQPEALRAVVSERTAGLIVTNPEDTGIFNPRIAEMVDLVHQAGGLCASLRPGQRQRSAGHHPRPRGRLRCLSVQSAQDLLYPARLRRTRRRGLLRERETGALLARPHR